MQRYCGIVIRFGFFRVLGHTILSRYANWKAVVT